MFTQKMDHSERMPSEDDVGKALKKEDQRKPRFPTGEIEIVMDAFCFTRVKIKRERQK